MPEKNIIRRFLRFRMWRFVRKNIFFLIYYIFLFWCILLLFLWFISLCFTLSDLCDFLVGLNLLYISLHVMFCFALFCLLFCLLLLSVLLIYFFSILSSSIFIFHTSFSIFFLILFCFRNLFYWRFVCIIIIKNWAEVRTRHIYLKLFVLLVIMKD